MRSLPTRADGGRALLVLALLGLASGAALLVVDIWRAPYHRQWDFHTYYHAPAALEAGLDPYDAASISQVSNKRWTPAFLYPPLTLHLFAALQAFEYPTAARLWLALKLLLAGVMAWQWRRWFAPRAQALEFAAFLSLAFGAAVAWDLKAGNVSIIEQILLWTAFACLLRDQPRAFCALLLAASLFKLAFLAFLPLLVLFDQRRKWLCLSATVGAMAAYLLANRLAHPELFDAYVREAATMNDLGSRYNSGLLAFLKDLSAVAGVGQGPAALVAYALIVLLTLALVARRLRPSWPALAADRRLAICLACALYAALMPRMKSYSCIILVLPAYVAVTRAQLRRPAALALLAVFALPLRTPFGVPVPVPAPFAPGSAGALLKDYYLLGLAWLVLAMLMRRLAKGEPTRPAPARGSTRE